MLVLRCHAVFCEPQIYTADYPNKIEKTNFTCFISVYRFTGRLYLSLTSGVAFSIISDNTTALKRRHDTNSGVILYFSWLTNYSSSALRYQNLSCLAPLLILSHTRPRL
jgi:lipoprotein signal peptidase